MRNNEGLLEWSGIFSKSGLNLALNDLGRIRALCRAKNKIIG
jgi:hypothetical protein